MDYIRAANAVIGKTPSQAEEIFRKNFPKFHLRIIWFEGNFMQMTNNINPNRLNIGIENGVIRATYNQYIDQDGVKYNNLSYWG